MLWTILKKIRKVAARVRYWTKHLKVPKEELQSVVEKVGNSTATVRKELAIS
ncbi:DUF3606 domain-containing protein [Tardiphaga sp. 866_E4_N2_1]|uniref:DUF3606 domain-containing protein n=1 Tax=unclassified Tardiphaga TaxID=2631404 RepID=UPI003F22CDF7